MDPHSDQNSQELCDSCQQFDAIIARADQARRRREGENTVLQLGHVKSIYQSRNCAICRSLTEIIADVKRASSQRLPYDCNVSNFKVQFDCRVFNGSPSMYLRFAPPKSNDQEMAPYLPPLAVNFTKRISSHEEIGYHYTSSEIDFKWVQQWLRCCDEYHPGCRPTDSSAAIGHVPGELEFFYLIDLDEKCIGDAAIGKLTRQNLQTLQKPNSLVQTNSDFEIPKTVSGAMTVAKALGMHFLWVDAFCIIQDDFDTMRTHLRSMTAIYAAACFTIVAAEGSSASYGLSGVNSSRSSHVRNHLLGLPSCDVFASIYQTEFPESSVWHSRGWTFQEYLFSRRMIIFNDERISWHCKSDHWVEGIQGRAQGRSLLAQRRLWPPLFNQSHLYYPDLYLWAKLVRQYTWKSLSFPADVLNAVEGVTNELHRAFPGGFHYGLPVLFFDIALLWEPYETTKHTTRRDVELLGPAGTTRAPSWSWVGWEGSIDTDHWKLFADHLLTSEGSFSLDGHGIHDKFLSSKVEITYKTVVSRLRQEY
ncbi:MAG: hypothetical protein M1813_008341 [Trichoglossum hirsutum]|nr:MAG: hypothetical protein M1813_008341 [Trichoglossum hirsutum]